MNTECQALTAGTYERVSRLKDDREDRRDRERSVDQQRTENERACQRHGWTIVPEHRYADPGRSASRFARVARVARENWQGVLDAVKARRFDVLVLWETSRASRDPLMTSSTTCRNRSTGNSSPLMVFTMLSPVRRLRSG